MAEDKRHDSLAPKGAFAAEAGMERAAANTARLIPRQPAIAELDTDDDEPLITVGADDADDAALDNALCADALIPSADRVSVEDAMRTLIDMRLERTRPSDEHGVFELAGSDGRAHAMATPSFTPATHSLAPIELAPSKPSATPATSERKRSPFPLLLAAAVVLLGIGLYRRADRQPSHAATAHSAAQADTTPAPVIGEALAPKVIAPVEPQAAEPEAAFEALDVSESDDAILTLGTPTIVNVAPREERALVDKTPRAPIGPGMRATKEATASAEVDATRVPAKPVAAPALPEAPSREAIVAGFQSVRDEVLACAKGGGGVAPIEATIVGDGRITHATVGGYYQGTPEGSCIARVLRKARFAPFSRESFKVAFPYTL